jgi:hypothetical protein
VKYEMNRPNEKPEVRKSQPRALLTLEITEF